VSLSKAITRRDTKQVGASRKLERIKNLKFLRLRNIPENRKKSALDFGLIGVKLKCSKEEQESLKLRKVRKALLKLRDGK
jgi:hypothetical protein